MAQETGSDTVIVPTHPFEKPAAARAGPAVEPVCPTPTGVGGNVIIVEEGQVDLGVDHGMRFKDSNLQKIGYGWEWDFPIGVPIRTVPILKADSPVNKSRLIY
jgi:hypothetical protein